MSKKTTNNSLAVATIGKSVPDALALLRKELKALNDITESSYKTGGSGNVQGFPNSIQTETSVEVLVKMVSSVNGRAKAYDDSCAILDKKIPGGFSAPVFKENGATVEAVIDDVALRVQVLSVKERREELQALLKEAETFMTNEDKFEMFKQRLATKLAGLAPEELS